MKGKRAYRYSWTKHYATDAQVIGDWLQSLPNRTPEVIVSAAEDPTSPAHAIIWTVPEDEAAMQYRLLIARTMVNSLRIEVIDAKKKPKMITAFISSADRTGYVCALEATSEELTAAEQKCWRQMQRFKQQHSDLKFAEQVIQAIHATEQQAVRRRKRG